MATRQAVNNTRATTPVSVPEITRIQVEGNDTVSFLYGTTPPYQWVRGMSQIMTQNPAYISYRYDTITISQVAGESFTFTVYSITDVGGNTFPALTSLDTSDVVAAKTQEIYRLLVTSIFKGCCECGNTEPECSIQYTAGDSGAENPGIFVDGGSAVRFNYFTANNQDFTGFWPIVQDGSWVFIFSKTDPTVYGVYQLSNYSDGGTFAQFDSTLITGPAGFPAGTSLCVDVTSVGGSLVQDWQDTLNISSLLTQDNLVDGGGFDFEWENVEKYIVNSFGYQSHISTDGSSVGQVYIQPGGVTITGTDFIDVITPGWATATPGMVLALDSSGHVEYTLAGTGTISSIGLNMPPAFTVSTPNPLTSNGSFTVGGAGTDLEYINGLGELATLPVYTVENGLHAFGGVPGETPPDPFLFHLGGVLIEDTVITTTDGTTEYVLGISGTADQNSRRPLAVSNLGNGGAAVFSDYSSGFRANASVQMLTDNDLFQPILDLTMQGDLPAGGILNDRTTMLRLKYDGAPAIGARTSIDYQFKNDDLPPNNPYFIAGRLTTEITNFTANAEESNFELQLFSAGSRGNKLVMEGKGQLELTNYATSQFWNGDTNIDNSLTYVLAVDGSGKVWKKLSESGGTVQEVSATGLLTTSPNPITVTGTVSSEMDSGYLVGRYSAGTGVFEQIVIGSGLTLTGDTLTADGGTGFDVQVNTTTIIPPATVLNLKSGTDIDVIHEGGGAVRFDYVGTGTSYDGNEGIYKDTSLSPETFMLGAPVGLGNTIPFSQSREIVTKTSSLNFIGKPNTANIINVTGTSGTNTSKGIAVDYSAANKSTAFFGNVASGSIGMEIVGQGQGFDVKQIAASTIDTQSPVPGIADVLTLNNSLNQTAGDGARLNLNSATIESYYTDNSTETNLRFSVKTTGSTSPYPALELDGTKGQVIFNEYGQTPAVFPDASPVWALGVDASGNVVEFDPGGSGPTYTVDNGLTEDPANNFQLGGPLVIDTNILGGTTLYLNFVDLHSSTNTARYSYSFATNDSNNNALLSLDSSNNISRFSHEDATTTKISAIELTGTELRVQTPLYSSKTAGDVLTLVDPATGEAEWSSPTGGGIPFGIATGTDTYAVSAGTASTYTDGDAYLVRFTNGNTGGSTLNVNGIGAADMYSNSDGLLIGGDIWAGAQMLCIYNSSLPGFQCIGTSTNSLFAYVTNAEATTITKGTAVYASGGTGDRMTVMKALATGDSTSALTVGMVFADIAAGQKGIILIQGELVGLNLFPTSGQPVGQNWSDGDPIYLSSTTAGGVTRVKQYAPNHLVYLGICVKASNGSAGRMYVRIQNGYELDELHNVQAQSPADKDTLWYDNSVTPKQWKTASVPSLSGTFSLGITVDGSGGVITAGVKGYVRVPYACTINTWSILTNNSGVGATITFDIWRANNAIPTVGGSLVGAGTKPFLTSNTAQITSAAPTGWTSVTLAANDILGFNVESGAAVFSWANLQLLVTKI